jgi:putative hemolysin
LSRCLESPERLIVAILIGTNLSNVLAASLTTHTFEDNPIPFAASVTCIVLVFGEIVPKTLFQHRPLRLMLIFSDLLRVSYFILRPFAEITSRLVNSITQSFSISEFERSILSKRELKYLVEVGEERKVLKHFEGKMLEGVFELSDKTVREVMTPRIEIVAVDGKWGIERILKEVLPHKHSRIPVYEENIDHVVGILHVKELLRYRKKEVCAEDLMEAPYFVPPSKTVGQLLQEFRKKKIHIAVVVDEYGGVSGIVTMEDLLEEIVGEMFDEYDRDESFFKQIDDKTFLVDPKIGIDEVNERLGCELPKEPFGTLSGLILAQLNRIPRPLDEVTYEDLRLIILEADERRIRKVKIIKCEE